MSRSTNWLKMGLFFCCGIAFGCGGAFWIAGKNPAASSESANYEDRLRRQIKQMEQLRIGSTRKEVLELFEQQGGLFRPKKCRFYFRETSCIHLNVEFECRNDKITGISPPFLSSGLTLD